MFVGTPDEARWLREEPRRSLPTPLLERIIHTAFPRCRVLDVQPLADGLRNANFKLQLDSTAESIVLRIYEHHNSLCQKEVDLNRLVGRSVPVPELIHMQPLASEDLPPFALLRHVEGISFRELKRRGDTDALGRAAFCAGQTLASIGRITFPKPGWLGPGPGVTAAPLESVNCIPRFIDSCLASTNLQRRVETELRDRTQALVWSWAPHLAQLDDEACLVHGDYGKRNLLMRSMVGKWFVAAVLDWEFAVSSSPLTDIGHFLRYESASRPLAEPHFSSGYLDGGGRLPQNWRQLARLVDLSALCESLTQDHLPDTVVTELIELVRATVENRDPQLA